MKHQYKILSILLASSLLSACSSDELTRLSEPVSAIFSASIGNASRANGTLWTAGDAIAISGVSGEKTYANVKYATVSGDGQFSPSDDPILYMNTDPVSFTAYYPYTANLASDGIITASTADQTDQASLHFLWAQATGNYAGPDVAFRFTPCMSRIEFTFTANDGAKLDEMTCTIDGLLTEGSFNTVTGVASLTEGVASATVTPAFSAKNANGCNASAIVFPQEAAPITLNATVAGQVFNCRLLLPELLSGYNYRLNINISRTEMTTGNWTITGWGNGGAVSDEVVPVTTIGDKKADEATIGDFYMGDGSLVDKDATLTDEQVAACIGIVFTTAPSRIGDGAKAALAAKGIAPHGLVMALTKATATNPCWSNKEIDEPELTETDNLQKMYQNVDGYTETRQIIDRYNSLETDYPAFYFVSRYGMAGSDTDKYAAPEKSTGWFMPSIGQWWDIMRNLGNVAALDNHKNDSSDYIRLDNQGSIARGNINSYLTKIPGSESIGSGDHYWTSSEFTKSNVVGVSFISDGSFYFDSNYKYMLVYLVRCILAF